MELFNYYSLDECLNLKVIKKTLTDLQKQGKIEFNLEGDLLKIKDIDLDETELSELVDLFDDNDIFPYPDYQDGTDEEDDSDYGDYDGYDSEEEDY